MNILIQEKILLGILAILFTQVVIFSIRWRKEYIIRYNYLLSIVIEFYDLIKRVELIISTRSFSKLYDHTSEQIWTHFLEINKNSNIVFPIFRIKQILFLINYNIGLADDGKEIEVNGSKTDRYGTAVKFGEQYLNELKHHYNFLVRELISMNKLIFRKMPAKIKYI